MVAVIVICLIALATAAYYFWLRPSHGRDSDHELAPPRFAGFLSSERLPDSQADIKGMEASRLRARLIDRARAGDLTTLSEAHSIEDSTLYYEVLDALIDSASDGNEQFRALVSHIAKSKDFRGNKRLAEHLMAIWETAPDRRSTIEMMHVAALSDDAGVYRNIVELIIGYWQKGALVEFSSAELIELFDSQFWVLAPEARKGGAGFALKGKLADVRRDLATPTPVRP